MKTSRARVYRISDAECITCGHLMAKRISDLGR